MPRVHRAFSVLRHRVTQPTAGTAAGYEPGYVLAGGVGGELQEGKKGSQCEEMRGSAPSFSREGGLKVARKLTSCPAMTAAAATSHPGWGAVSGPQRA